MVPHGFIDLDGNIVIEPKFFTTDSFQRGLCLVETGKQSDTSIGKESTFGRGLRLSMESFFENLMKKVTPQTR